MSLRLVLVDDNDRVRANLRTMLACKDDWQIFGEGADGERAIAKVLELAPRGDYGSVDAGYEWASGCKTDTAARPVDQDYFLQHSRCAHVCQGFRSRCFGFKSLWREGANSHD